MNKLEEKRLKKEIWRNMVGCKCPTHIDGKPYKERCTPTRVACNERLARIHRDLKKHGLTL